MKIIISGTTGVGKSTTVNKVKEYYEQKGKEVVLLTELVVESPFFELFYDSLESWGLLGQIEFVMGRFKQWMEIEEAYKNKNPNDYVIIYDRHFLEDLVFADLKSVRNAIPSNLSKAYYAIYDQLVDKINYYEKPDFFILLRATYDTVIERQMGRGRKEELDKEDNNIDNKFWQDLYYRYYGSKKYRKLFKDYTKHFVEIDTDDNSPDEVREKVIKYIEKRYK